MDEAAPPAGLARALWERGPLGLLVTRAGAIERYNPVAAAILGPDLVGQRLVDLLPAGVEASAEPLEGSETELVYLSDRREGEALRRERDEWRGALEDALYGYDVVDAEGFFTYANRAYLAMWGYERLEEVLGSSPAEHCADPETPGRLIAAVEREGQTTQEFQGRRKDGSTFDVLMAVQRSQDDRGRPIYRGTSLDVTELNRLRNELHHHQKLEALGGFAANVAHDFNNLLVPILGYAELLQLRQTTRIQREGLAQIEQAARSARDLTQQLLSATRKQVLSKRPVELRGAVREAAALVQRFLRANVRLELREAEGATCRVLVDPAQLQQVLLNLVNNAQDAMPKGGELHLEVGERSGAGLAGGRLAPGRYGEIVVRDTGHGMSPPVLEQIFDPFFTTKGARGTGLGLASARGVVRQHEGEVVVESELGAGTTFRIYLPATERVVPSAPAASPRPPSGVAAHVLVADDDEAVRRFTLAALRSGGHRPYGAASAASALELLQGLETPPALLLTDVVLTDTNGQSLAEAVRTACPSIRVLYMSGYGQESLAPQGLLAPEIDYLAKPFTCSELLRRVERAIAGSA